MDNLSHLQLARAVTEWQERSGNLVTDIESFSGTGNTTYLLKQENHLPVVLRFNGATEHLGVNRQREETILRLLGPENLSPELLYQSADFWVFSFVGRTGQMHLANLASSLHCLHQINTPWVQSQRAWTPLDTINDYLTLVPQLKPILQQHLSGLEGIWHNTNYTLCHMDLNPGNIIHGSDRTIFVDWEYARVGPAIFDIAVLTATHGWSPALIAEFLALYPAEINTRLLLQSVLAYKIIELLWLKLYQDKDWPLSRLEEAAARL